MNKATVPPDATISPDVVKTLIKDLQPLLDALNKLGSLQDQIAAAQSTLDSLNRLRDETSADIEAKSAELSAISTKHDQVLASWQSLRTQVANVGMQR